MAQKRVLLNRFGWFRNKWLISAGFSIFGLFYVIKTVAKLQRPSEKCDLFVLPGLR
jgi:hypothetical protein